ncbi:MAG: spore photoproduct lyase family protein [Candidatus Omnitrophota bacterium]
MRLYKKQSDLLKKTRSLVNSKFPGFGINKKQEIIRLIYEISKKESVSPEIIIKDIDLSSFENLKKRLLKKRYPYAYLHNEIGRPYLPKMALKEELILDVKKDGFYPKKIFIEKSAWRSRLADKFRGSFPRADYLEIKTLKDYLKTNRNFTIKDYNHRRDTAFIAHENYDFFKRCPCTKKAVGCGYNIFNLSFGCIFDCTYCYLQEYTNSPGLIFPANLDRFFNEFGLYKRSGMRIGTGEFSDSLMLDNITEYCLPIVDFFKKHKDVTFEFKTKSKNIQNLLQARHSGNIVISWSLNPQRIIDENEFFTASLNDRVRSARQCVEAGYKVAFHFDPVMYFCGWREEYKKVTELLFGTIKPKDISWISIGTLRFNPRVKQIIESRFPANKILDEELVPGFDNKLRYPYGIRRQIYEHMLSLLSKYSKKIPVYLCMEDIFMWRELKLRPVAISG